MTDPTSYTPVRRGTDVGALTLDGEQLCWKPTGKNAKDVTATTIPWNTVSKAMANPPKNAKALLKIVSSSSETVTFQTKNRAILDKLKADIDQRRKDCSNSSDVKAEAAAETTDKTAPADTADKAAPADTADKSDKTATETTDKSAPADTADKSAPADKAVKADKTATDTADKEAVDAADTGNASTEDAAAVVTDEKTPQESTNETKAVAAVISADAGDASTEEDVVPTDEKTSQESNSAKAEASAIATTDTDNSSSKEGPATEEDTETNEAMPQESSSDPTAATVATADAGNGSTEEDAATNKKQPKESSSDPTEAVATADTGNTSTVEEDATDEKIPQESNNEAMTAAVATLDTDNVMIEENAATNVKTSQEPSSDSTAAVATADTPDTGTMPQEPSSDPTVAVATADTNNASSKEDVATDEKTSQESSNETKAAAVATADTGNASPKEDVATNDKTSQEPSSAKAATVATADTDNTSPKEEDATNEKASKESSNNTAAAPTTTYLNVILLSNPGTVTLSVENLTYQPDSKGKTLTVGWDTVTKHQASPAKIPKAMMKIVLTSGKNHTLQLADRKELLRLKKDITSRLESFKQQPGPSASDSEPTVAEAKEKKTGASAKDDTTQTEPNDENSNQVGEEGKGQSTRIEEEGQSSTGDAGQPAGGDEKQLPGQTTGAGDDSVSNERGEEEGNASLSSGEKSKEVAAENDERGGEGTRMASDEAVNEEETLVVNPTAIEQQDAQMDEADSQTITGTETGDGVPENDAKVDASEENLEAADTSNDAGKSGVMRGSDHSIDEIQDLVKSDSGSGELSLSDSIDSLGGSDSFSNSFGHVQTETDAPNEEAIQMIMDDDGAKTDADAMASGWEEDPEGSFNNSVENFDVTEEIPPEEYYDEGGEEYAEDGEMVDPDSFDESEDIIEGEGEFDDDDEANTSSLLGGADSGEEESDVEDYDVLEGKTIKDEEDDPNEPGDKMHYMDRLGIQYEDDDHVVPVGGDDLFFDDSSHGADDSEESAMTRLKGTSLPPALKEGRKGGADDESEEDAGSDAESYQSEDKSSDDEVDSRSSGTASFASESNSEIDSGSGSGSASEEDSEATSDDEDSDEEEEEEEVPEYHDPASAWLTFSETKDEDVLPEADVRILKEKSKKKTKKKKKRDDSEREYDEEYYSDEEEQYSDEEDYYSDENDETEESEGSEGSMELELDVDDLSVHELESALAKKLQSEVGGKDSLAAQRAVNQMLASLREDLLNGVAHTKTSRRSQPGMPEDFYDWAKQTARKVIDRDGVGADAATPPFLDPELFFDWGKFAKEKKAGDQPATDNNAAEAEAPPEPASEAAPGESSTAMSDDKQPQNGAAAPQEPTETTAGPSAPQELTETTAGPSDLLEPYDGALVDRWTLRPVADDPESRLFNWKGFTNARRKSSMATTPQAPSFDWKKHSKEQRKLAKKAAKANGSSADGEEKKSEEEQQPPKDVAGKLTGIDLLKMLVVTNDDSGRAAILAKHIAPPASPDQTDGLVSPKELLAAIAKFVDTVRTVKKSDNAPEITSARQVAIAARLSIIELYGDGSDILREFEMGLAPAFAPKFAD